LAVKRGETILIGAALSGVAAVVCATSSLTIALVARAHPPVYPYPTPAGNAAAGNAIDLQVSASVIALIGATLALALVVVRRPAWKPPISGVSRWDFGWSLVIMGIVFVFTMRSLFLAISAIDFTQPITNSPSFSGLSSSLDLLALVFMIVTSWMYALWCRVTGGPQEDPHPLRLAWRLGRAVRGFSGK
jgi:hypothetical protein